MLSKEQNFFKKKSNTKQKFKVKKKVTYVRRGALLKGFSYGVSYRSFSALSRLFIINSFLNLLLNCLTKRGNKRAALKILEDTLISLVLFLKKTKHVGFFVKLLKKKPAKKSKHFLKVSRILGRHLVKKQINFKRFFPNKENQKNLIKFLLLNKQRIKKKSSVNNRKVVYWLYKRSSLFLFFLHIIDKTFFHVRIRTLKLGFKEVNIPSKASFPNNLLFICKLLVKGAASNKNKVPFSKKLSLELLKLYLDEGLCIDALEELESQVEANYYLSGYRWF